MEQGGDGTVVLMARIEADPNAGQRGVVSNTQVPPVREGDIEEAVASRLIVGAQASDLAARFAVDREPILCKSACVFNDFFIQVGRTDIDRLDHQGVADAFGAEAADLPALLPVPVFDNRAAS